MDIKSHFWETRIPVEPKLTIIHFARFDKSSPYNGLPIELWTRTRNVLNSTSRFTIYQVISKSPYFISGHFTISKGHKELPGIHCTYMYTHTYIHPRKLTWHPKIDTWKRSFLLETIILRFHVSSRECIYIYIHIHLLSVSLPPTNARKWHRRVKCVWLLALWAAAVR